MYFAWCLAFAVAWWTRFQSETCPSMFPCPCCLAGQSVICATVSCQALCIHLLSTTAHDLVIVVFVLSYLHLYPVIVKKTTRTLHPQFCLCSSNRFLFQEPSGSQMLALVRLAEVFFISVTTPKLPPTWVPKNLVWSSALVLHAAVWGDAGICYCGENLVIKHQLLN